MNITLANTCIPAMTSDEIAKVREHEAFAMTQPQEPITTFHVLHAGMYSRTIKLCKGNALTGALIKVPTTITVSGDATAYLGGEEVRITGYHVIPAKANRKQEFYAHEDTYLTMQFITSAKTIEDVEAEFTDESERLSSRVNENIVTITGD